jgi:L-threonylcarbamoyladenylate synthase
MGLSRALAELRSGNVIAIPTDTVYGIGALVTTQGAMEKIYELKTRPGDLALPVLIGRPRDYKNLAAAWTRSARSLAARFWPGPLTLVVEANPAIVLPNALDGSVGLRCPDHNFLRKLLKSAGPIAVTSANKHGATPGASANDVANAFVSDERLSLIVDGGMCEGVPSTVVDVRTSTPTCLREGAIRWSWIEASLR